MKDELTVASNVLTWPKGTDRAGEHEVWDQGPPRVIKVEGSQEELVQRFSTCGP